MAAIICRRRVLPSGQVGVFTMKSMMSFILVAAFAAVLSGAPAPQPWGGASSYRVMFLGDTHFDGEEFHTAPETNKSRLKARERNLKMWKLQSPKLLEAAEKRANADSVKFAVQLGDIAQGDCDSGELQKAMLAKAFATVKKAFPQIPLLVVKGNHDIRTVKRNRDNAAANAALLPLVAKELKVAKLVNGNYAFRQGPDLFIAIDGFIPAKEGVAFVKKTLDDNPNTRYVFFMTHLPVLPAAVGAPLWLVPGHYQIAAMLEKRRTLILAAHTHIPSLVTRSTANGRLSQLIVSSMGNSWRAKVAAAKIKDWPGYTAAMKKAFFQGKQAANRRKQWKTMESKGTYTYKQLFHNSGFVVLDVNDRKVESRYYINGSNKPASTMLLMVNR